MAGAETLLEILESNNPSPQISKNKAVEILNINFENE